MGFPRHRPRRLRRSAMLRRMVRETALTLNDLVCPLFVIEGTGRREPVPSMPGQCRWSVDWLVKEAAGVYELGIPAVMVFGVPAHKDDRGTAAWAPDGVVSQAVRALKDRMPDLLVATDVCIDEYTTHGHCGLVREGRIVNDETLECLCLMAAAHAEAGADVVAPSDMMDGRVGAIRDALDERGFEDVAIMSYAAKYASCLYAPFRDAVSSGPAFGDRCSYQMDPANAREAVREVRLDAEEGADVIMVKPALPCLDVIARTRAEVAVPVAAYQVSGEYSMIKAAAGHGWLDESGAMMETLLSIKRAGADFILTYFARDAARHLHASRP